MENLRLNALALHLGVDVEDLVICSYNDQVIEYGSQEYLVVTDDEADYLWDDDLENYIDECIIDQIPEQYRNYFDRESWKSDARYDGRGHSLNRYDGCEDQITVHYYTYNDVEYYHTDDLLELENEALPLYSNETFYIYRQN